MALFDLLAPLAIALVFFVLGRWYQARKERKRTAGERGALESKWHCPQHMTTFTDPREARNHAVQYHGCPKEAEMGTWEQTFTDPPSRHSV